tara:strand:- start:612 stop:884 length:273 start_codon:yes stop_codon:yes gene_type:complete
MKTTLKFENIEKTGSGIEFANITCEMPFKGAYSDSVKVKLSCTSSAIRIMSDHLLREMTYICENLDADKIRQFAKDMLKASKTLNEVRSI